MQRLGKPLVKRIAQVALVVKDCQATARHYWEDLGVGPWEFYTFDPSNTPGMMLRGEPVRHAFRAALATIGDLQLELIEPLAGPSVYAEHLAAHGEGLHHLAFEADNFERTAEHLKSKGYSPVQSGRPFDLITYAYFDTDRRLGCLTEWGSDLEADKSFPAPESTYP